MRRLVKATCLECGRIFGARSDHVVKGRVKYCGVSCSSRAKAKARHKVYDQSGANNPNYKGSLALTNYQAKLKQVEKFPDRVAARNATGSAIRRGKLIKGTCELCGRNDTQAHHDNYADPLKVRWLCPMCHGKLHKRSTGRGRK